VCVVCVHVRCTHIMCMCVKVHVCVYYMHICVRVCNISMWADASCTCITVKINVFEN